MALPSCMPSGNPCYPGGVMINGECSNCGLGQVPQCSCSEFGGEQMCKWFCGNINIPQGASSMKIGIYLVVLLALAGLVYWLASR